MPALGARLREAAARLAPVTETPRLDAEILMAHSLGCSRAQLLARLQEDAPAPGFEELAARRAEAEPIAYIIGEWEFFGLPLLVEPPLLVPRPETEHLVEAALEHLARRPGPALDLCTGTSCVALAVARHRPDAAVTAADLSPKAVEVARRNARRLELDARVRIRRGDLFEALRPADGPFEAITANPPYVEDSAWDQLPPVIRRYEDPQALLGGPDGLAVARRIAGQARAWLRPGGLLAMEVGEGQAAAAVAMLEARGFAQTRTRRDLAGIERIVEGIAPDAE